FSARGAKDLPQVTSYDYDALLTEAGEPTEKYYAVQKAIKDMLAVGSLNLYMFHGGTNFGFYNGCSARGTIDLPQITSYDYDAPLDEQGNPTEK
ncbi:beta-galactosidase, partial [Enterococcus faecalis]|uniref:beta-galactosidase n=1 Tax=Enterococcus faecalis TaxID=1351 RepID=UPI001002E45D